MKLIRSVVRPSKLDEIKEALSKISVLDMTVANVRDCGPQHIHMTLWRTQQYQLDVAQRVEIEVIVHDGDVDEVVGAIMRAARTTEEADGHVSVMPVDGRYNIHSGEREAS